MIPSICTDEGQGIILETCGIDLKKVADVINAESGFCFERRNYKKSYPIGTLGLSMGRLIDLLPKKIRQYGYDLTFLIEPATDTTWRMGYKDRSGIRSLCVEDANLMDGLVRLIRYIDSERKCGRLDDLY